MISASLQTARISGARGVPHRRPDIVDNRLPCFVGDLSTGANPVLIDRFRQADLLLAVGARIGEITSQSYSLLGIPDPGKTLIHVHVGAEELGRVFRPSLAIQSGMPEFAAAVAAMDPLPPARWSAWRAALRREYEAWLTPAPSGAALDLGEVMNWLRRRLPDDAIVTSDAGNFSGWPNRYLQYRRPGRQLGPTSGAMGYGPRRGRRQAHPSRPARRRLLRRRRFFDDRAGAGNRTRRRCRTDHPPLQQCHVRHDPDASGAPFPRPGRRYGAREPGFSGLARAYGAFGAAVSRTEEFAPISEEAAARRGAAVIELKMDPDEITTRTTLSAIRRHALNENPLRPAGGEGGTHREAMGG